MLYQYAYGWTAGDYPERSVSYCLVESSGVALNKVYEFSGKYPDSDQWIHQIKNAISGAGCSTDIQITNNQLLDGFNDPICYNRVSDSKVFIYSLSTFTPGLYKSYIGYKLTSGELHYLYIDGDAVCNSNEVKEVSIQ